MMNFKLSPSDLTYLYEGCKFCFWLKIRHGIGQPSMPMPGIFSAIAGRQKEFYSGKRTESFCAELPPGVVEYGEVPVGSIPVSLAGADISCYIRGRFDCVVKFDDGSYGIIDFKTASPSEAKAEMYARQLQAYAYALENPSDGMLKLAPISKLGLLFFEPFAFDQIAMSEQAFKGKTIWIRVERNEIQFASFLQDVMKTLAPEAPPESASDCVWCSYRNKTKHLNGSGKSSPAAPSSNIPQPSTSPLCPQCNALMTLKNGKYGQFWSCQRFPDCRGTRKP